MFAVAFFLPGRANDLSAHPRIRHQHREQNCYSEDSGGRMFVSFLEVYFSVIMKISYVNIM